MSLEKMRPGEHMIRSWVDADLKELFQSTSDDPNKRLVMEEAVIGFAHEVFELGRTLERTEGETKQGEAYLRGMQDGLEIRQQRGEQ